ncbi:MAG: hypothetical protein OEO83_02185 [Alphaproteobacteria bacterium]|nr:hypothetical protein [Alphaproteobacteria bacterium]
MYTISPHLKGIFERQLKERAGRTGPAKRATTTVKGTALFDLQFRGEVEGHSFISDERESSGGHDAGPAPMRYFIAAVMFCHKVWTVKKAGLMGLAFDRLDGEISWFNDVPTPRIVYKGKPIFYSLGNFIFQNETVQWVPHAAYEGFGLGADDTPGDWGWGRSQGGKHGHAGNPVFYRSAVPECRYKNGALAEILLHPVDLGFGQPIGQRGRPVMAEGEVAQEVLSWLQRVSEPYGTDIVIEGDKGVIRV